jgi:transposase InsO family protein
MCGPPPSLPGPRPGHKRRPLTEAQKAKAREYRKGGMPVPSLARALSEDFGTRVTAYQVRRLKHDEGWPALRPRKIRKPHQPFDKTLPGFVHVDTIIGPTTECPVIYTARERSSRLSWAMVSSERTSAAAARFLKHITETSPLKVHTILTDNGSEFKKDFAAAVSRLGLQRRHTRARHPQTNGMVERFNGLLKEGVETRGIWWCAGSKDRNTDWEKMCLENYRIPLPDHRVRRMQRDLDRYLLWINCVKPNRQLAWKTPLEWMKDQERSRPEDFQHPTTTIISEENLYRMTKDLGGQRYLPKPPPNWPPGALVSIDL